MAYLYYSMFFQSRQKLTVLFRHLFFDLKGVNAFIFAVILEGFSTGWWDIYQ